MGANTIKARLMCAHSVSWARLRDAKAALGVRGVALGVDGVALCLAKSGSLAWDGAWLWF